MEINAKYINFIRKVPLNALDDSINSIDSLINALNSNLFPDKIAFFFKTGHCPDPVCEIKINSPFSNCFKIDINFIDKKDPITLANFALQSNSTIGNSQGKHYWSIDTSSIDLEFQELRQFISTFFGGKFSYCFLDSDPTKAKQITVCNLTINETKIELKDSLCFKRDIDPNGCYSFPDDQDIRKLIEYGFSLELTNPLQYYQSCSSNAYPVYQLVCNTTHINNYETNLQLLKALAMQDKLDDDTENG